jgi:predicted transcriptional regulator
METLSPKLMDFIEAVYVKKKATRKDIPMASISYYFWAKVLKDNGIIKMDGLDGTNQHIYMLTPKGEQIAVHVVELKKLLRS